MKSKPPPSPTPLPIRWITPHCPLCKCEEAFGVIPCVTIPGDEYHRNAICRSCGKLFHIQTQSVEWGEASAHIVEQTLDIPF